MHIDVAGVVVVCAQSRYFQGLTHCCTIVSAVVVVQSRAGGKLIPRTSVVWTDSLSKC